MRCSRRNFLKLAGVGTLCLTLGQLGVNLDEALAYSRSLKIEGAKEVVTICPFCAVCCQVIAYVRDGKLVSTEGIRIFRSTRARSAPRARPCTACTPTTIG